VNLDLTEAAAVGIDDRGSSQNAPMRKQCRHHLRRGKSVLHRDVDALAIVVRSQPFERVIEVRHLGAQDDERVRARCDGIADETVAAYLDGAVRTVQQQTETPVPEKTLRPDAEGDVPSSCMQACAEHSANRAGAND
jgi:hypothetical protein